jgi:hypothetical protein
VTSRAFKGLHFSPDVLALPISTAHFFLPAFC